MSPTLSALLLALPVFLGTGPAQPAAPEARPAGKVTVKLATLVPDGSVWDKAFKRMASEWNDGTDGRVKMKIYPGGVAGDEPDIVRKLRIGQLNAAALSLPGLAEIEPGFEVFEIPMFFESHEELMHVLDGLTPILDKRLEEAGFIRLHWGHAGWIHLFTKEPVRKPDDLRKLKQFVWEGNSAKVEWWKSNGFKPVPLPATEIPSALQTGLIEAVPAPPVTALALQWFRSTPYMMDLGALPFLGATILSKEAWDKISAEDQKLILASCKKTEEYLAIEVPKQEAQSIEEMKKRGLVVIAPDEEGDPWRKIADDYMKNMSSSKIPKVVFDRAKGLCTEFRSL